MRGACHNAEDTAVPADDVQTADVAAYKRFCACWTYAMTQTLARYPTTAAAKTLDMTLFSPLKAMDGPLVLVLCWR